MGEGSLQTFCVENKMEKEKMKKHILAIYGFSALAIILLSGCAAPQVNKTIGLSSVRYPVVSSDGVEIIKRGKEINRNFQIVGKVTVPNQISD